MKIDSGSIDSVSIGSPLDPLGEPPCALWQQVARWAGDLGDASSAAEPDLASELAEHLVHCSGCQQRLEQSVASPAWWRAAAEWLAEQPPDSSGASMAIPAIASECAAAHDPAASRPTEGVATEIPPGLLQPPSHPELLGRLGRYEIERLIGQGGMGLVFRAFDPQLHRVVAVKLLAPQLAASASARERFAREARAVAGLSHPHLIAIHDVVADGPLPYLVMTYIDGVSLEQLVRSEGPMPVQQVIQLARQLVSGLSAAHEAGLIHRDIKPGNILCEAVGQRAVLTDFGLVRALDDATLTHSGVLAGTPHFMAPEQARGGQVGPESDLWAVGAVIYFALTGRPPFEAEHPIAVLHQVCHARPTAVEKLRPDVWPELAEIVERLLRKTPAARYRDCAALREDLDSLARQGRRRWPLTRLRRRRWARRVAGVAIIAASIPAIWLVGRRGTADPVADPASGTATLAVLQADARWGAEMQQLDQQTRGMMQAFAAAPAGSAAAGNMTAAPTFQAQLDQLMDQVERLEQTLQPAGQQRDGQRQRAAAAPSEPTQKLLQMLQQIPEDDTVRF